MEKQEKKAYLPIGAGRLLDIRVILDDNVTDPFYEGMIENAPENVKRLRYSNVECADKMVFYVYSELN